MFQVKVLVAIFKIWGCFSTPKHLLIYGLGLHQLVTVGQTHVGNTAE